MICHQCGSNTLVVQCERCARFYCDLHREHNCKVLQAERKIQLPPQSSKHMRGLSYPGNPADICSRISIVWLLTKIFRKPVDITSYATSRSFYEGSSKIPPELHPSWRADWMKVMEENKLLPPSALDEKFTWTCENIFGSMNLFAILHSFGSTFSIKVTEIIKNLAELGDDREVYIIIASTKLAHAMAATIKIGKMWYHTLKFFDPNCMQGEMGVRLSPTMQESWSESIEYLMRDAGFFPPPDTDLTIICLCKEPDRPLAITNFEELRGVTNEDRICFLYSMLQIMGGRGGAYLHYILQLIDQVSPWSLGMLMPPNPGVTALFIAAQNGYNEVVRKILHVAFELPEPSQLFVLQARGDNVTALLIAVKNEHHEVVGRILDALSNLPIPSQQLLLQPFRDSGITALFMAAQKGYLEVVGKILDALSNLPIPSQQLLLQPTTRGFTALCVAAQSRHSGVVLRILDAASKLPDLAQRFLLQSNANGGTALLIAIESGYTEVISMILDALPRLPESSRRLLLQPMGTMTPLSFAKRRQCSKEIIDRVDAACDPAFYTRVSNFFKKF